MTYSPRTTAASLVLILGLASASSSAFAGTSAKTFMESVPYSQQELTTTQGVADVHQRVIDAAREICVGDDLRSRNVISSRLVASCAVEIANRALNGTDHEILASYHNSLEKPAHTGRSRFAKTDWTIEKFKMAQMEEPVVNALP